MDSVFIYDSPVGKLTIAAHDDAVTGLWLEGQKYYGATLKPHAGMMSLPVLESVARWLDLYFSGKQPDFMPKLAPGGSEFRQGVFRVLSEIPYGSVITYGEIARRMGNAKGSQAVGGAVGHNPISILIPCHRVVGTGGSLTGYAGGIEKKRYLLKLEGVDVDRYSVPAKGTAL